MLPGVASTSRIWIGTKDKEDDYRAISSELFLIAVMAKVAAEDEWSVSLKTNGTLFNFKLDTGAQAKVVSGAVILALKKNPKNSSQLKGKIKVGKAWAYGTKWVSVKGVWASNTENDWKNTWTAIVPQTKYIYLNLWPPTFSKGRVKCLGSKKSLQGLVD